MTRVADHPGGRSEVLDPDLDQDTPWYVYGLVRSADGPAAVAGLAGSAGEEVTLLELDDLAAVVEAVPDAGGLPASAFVRAHARVLDTVATRCTVIPVRFGTIMESGPVIDELLARDSAWVHRTLDELDGHVQLMVKARYDLDTVLAEVVREHPVVGDLSARTRDLPEDVGVGDKVRLGELVSRAMDAKREVDREWVLAALQPYAARSSARATGGLDGVLDLAVLVRDDGVEEFERRAQDTAQELAGRVRLQLLGPMAPYDFADGA